MDEFQWAKSFATSHYGTIGEDLISSQCNPRFIPKTTSRGSFATFVCHVVNLERKLRSSSPLVLSNPSNVRVTGKILGQGKTFLARHAQWVPNLRQPPLDIALKEIISEVQSLNGISNESLSSNHRPQTDWKDILFELRVLLHEPLRYHPNIVRLLGIQWGLSPISESIYPVLIMEYASFGTFKTLQTSSEPLPFPVKQKLCYDVGRALSALHACGIVHGDLKHENVLIFPSQDPIHGIPYTAKLADFGGSVMDMTPDESRKPDTWTWPFQAPEVTGDNPLTKSGMMLADTYSFGLLVWRAFMDGDGFVSMLGASQLASDEDKRSLSARKASNDLTNTAIRDIHSYAIGKGLAQDCVDVMIYIIFHTVQAKPEDRDLVIAQAALRGIKLGHISSYLSFIREANEGQEAMKRKRVPGLHGITQDSFGFRQARDFGHDADVQGNMPGFRPRLDEPNFEEFLFEPESLKSILTWRQQRQMLDEMKSAASRTDQSPSPMLELKRTMAAFYVFQCHLLEFGTRFNANEAASWLLKASSDDDSHENADYLSQAWLWRISRSLGIEPNISTEKLYLLLAISIVRGHRTCLEDGLQLVIDNSGSDQQRWQKTLELSRNILLSDMGAVGMGHFFSNYLTKPWGTTDMDDTSQLDDLFRVILGSEYGSCLKSFLSLVPTSSKQPGHTKDQTAFDCIYVNGRGHGPLHYAAAKGAINGLRHMLMKYECNIDIPNKHVDETPLICACESGKLECALLLLDKGADPNGYRYGQEGALHWLCSFLPTEMDIIASRLLGVGADIELRSRGMRHDVRRISADWEHIFEINTTPLGRAVLTNNLDAVKVLLKLGANPLTECANKHRGEWEWSENLSRLTDVSPPFELAAVLTLPEILSEFIRHIDSHNKTVTLRLLDECSMLDIAHGKKVTKFDPLSLQSRLVRCGVNYKRALKDTLLLLYARALPFRGTIVDDNLQNEQSRVLCKEVALGNMDIVESLLDLGYDANGTQDFRPLEKSIQKNHEDMFNLLLQHKADPTVARRTLNGNISMLHVCASRPRHSRPGRVIADALIASGIPVESADAQSRSPLATAILNQNFDVAQALIENGANVNAIYPIEFNSSNGSEKKEVRVLFEVLSQHTMRTLASLEFLFGRGDRGPNQRPAFHIDLTNKLSILHVLAGSPQFTQIAQITPKILNLCVDTYAESELINYKHPLLGTPLYYAAASGHKAMVERLQQHGADDTHNAGPDLHESIQLLLRPRESWTPLWAAILRFDDELKKSALFPPEGLSGASLNSNFILNLEKTILLLSANTDDALAAKAIEQLQRRKKSLETSLPISSNKKIDKTIETIAGENETPIDLSILSPRAYEEEEKKVQQICGGQEQEWKTGELEKILTGLEI